MIKWGEKVKTVLDKRNLIPAIIILLLIALLIGVYFSFKSEKEDKQITYKEYTIYADHKGGIEKYDPSMTVDGYKGGDSAYYITGKISAKENKKYSVITFNLYDENNKLLGTAVAGLNKLEKDKVYDFKALSLIKNSDVEKITHYKLKSVELG